MTEATPTHIRTEAGVGTGSPLILVHGVGLDHTMWDLVVPRLVAATDGPRAVVRYDLIGHGRSAAGDGPPTMAGFVEQLLAVADAGLGTDSSDRSDGSERDLDDRPDVVGLSLGGAIVRGAAARHPERFGRVVVANTVFKRDRERRQGNLERLRLAETQGMGPVADLAVDRWFTEAWQQAHPERVEAVRRRITSTDLNGYLGAYRVFVDGDPEMPELLPALANEVLFVTGDRDTGSTPAMTAEMADLVPNGTARVLAATGHLPPIERPDEFGALLIDFLKEPTTMRASQ